MNNVDDFVRSFGMSGYLITEELKRIEQQFAIELGHTQNPEDASAVKYYPQFEQEVRAGGSSRSSSDVAALRADLLFRAVDQETDHRNVT